MKSGMFFKEKKWKRCIDRQWMYDGIWRTIAKTAAAPATARILESAFSMASAAGQASRHPYDAFAP